MEKQLTICKEVFSEYSSNKVRYFSTTRGYNGYFEGDKNKTALTQAKEYAKENGFETMLLIGNKFGDKDKIYTL